MEENIDWLFDDPLPCVDMASCEPPLKIEVKCEAGSEEQLYDGTGVKAENSVKEEVQVKVEREDKASDVQCLCLSSPCGCGACVLKFGKTEASSEGGCAGMEGEQYLYKRNAEGKWQPYLVLKRKPETGLEGCGSLGPAEEKQCLEGGSVCEQEQAVNRAAGWGRWKVMTLEGAGECGSVCGREEKGGRNVGMEGVVQPLVSIEDCKVEVKPECCEETGVERLGEGEKVQVEGGVPVQARPESNVATGVRWSVCDVQWSDSSSDPVESSSNLEINEARSCMTSEETAQLLSLKRRCSPGKQQQCRKKGRVQSAGEGKTVSSSHSDAVRTPGGLKMKKHVCPHCSYSSVLKHTLTRHLETVHGDAKKHACPHCPYRAGKKGHLQTHIDTVHEGLKNHACPHCQYRAGRKGHLQIHIDTVHEGLKKHACPHCQYRAGRKGHLQTHIDTVHEGLKKFACPRCQYKTGRKFHLETHIVTVHEGLKKHACPHCRYRAGLKGDLKKHIKKVHEG